MLRTHSNEIQHHSLPHSRPSAIHNMVEQTSSIGTKYDKEPELETPFTVEISRSGELELGSRSGEELQQRRGKKEGDDEKLVAEAVELSSPES